MHDVEIAIWSIGTSVPETVCEAGRSWLSDAERTRADAFRFERDRQRFVVRRIFLRQVLARHLSVPPAAIAIIEGGGEKPRLDPCRHPGDLMFNLSQTGDLAACVVATGRRVGVDVERVRDLPELDGLARTAMSPRELAAWRELSPPTQTASFFTAWARKEALAKAEGSGLATGPSTLEVTIDAWPPGAVFATEHASTRWLLSDWSPGPGIAGCIALEARGQDAIVLQTKDETATIDRAETGLPGLTLIRRRYLAG